ncbi:Oidioi.mRNA.OKI2018_I69.PAR.g9812.t1.cds [Oikopleura dioica]|uniref:Oidioi.mRNA.OKI2018_I69.PAR.g9812.t1.cds n=1 Tax=Oikopleura dioica TaxID=34765 RepID=A0ABN7RMH6_OIKDI|nr:Oidioi.mRNA.OKI2018_I69.PAR.g9812.t1.cds [Oikopleura dioica]
MTEGRPFPDRIFWLDAEMTGLDVLGKDSIMEIACVVTDGELNVVAEGPELVFAMTNKQLKKMGPWCRKTHGESGLTQKCKDSDLTHEEGDEILADFIRKNCPKAPLAGNSVHADRQFMCKELPKSVKELHYRIIDVSSIKELAKRWYPGLPERNKDRKTGVGGAHTAKYDIYESIEELKHYRKNVFKDKASVSLD